ncbi:dioxygenase [Actinomadura rubrisoli]|uniref:6-chlorohydroxyquinol-1,2-dioxygenase n=1 Tax=Actinomadura rubrisoli TaxID=2530368 RepID=A0A4R5CDP0_9ACTN|nr:dioxygenase [Actinomadura rubrisoli]TDD95294.1 6-chlorohydroxyquinol-1,2-dioxygenase [Actinomadura rubrisoli]
MDFNESTALNAVLDSFDGAADPRTKEILLAVARHLHALVRDLRPTLHEWEQAIAFLTAVGHKCDDTRQEFVLLSDVLGISMLVETMNADPAGTEGTVLGPFHMVESPARENGDSIDLLGTGTPCLVSGTVTDTTGNPIADAEIDVWQCDEHGFYDVQQPGVQPPGNGRGLFRADDQGRFWFRTVVPSHYPIPTDGPVGRLLSAAGRHPYRPAHVHFIADAPGYRPVTTHIFVADSPYLDSDAVFAVRKNLIVDFTADGPDAAAPYRRACFDIRLAEEATTR